MTNPGNRSSFVDFYILIVDRFWSDADFAVRLEREPRVALAECGLDMPSDTRVRLVRPGVPTWDVGRAVRLWIEAREIELPHPPPSCRRLPDTDLGDLAGGRIHPSPAGTP